MIVCADDYGWSDDVNRAIVELVAARRVSAVSCMAGLPHCAPDNLKPLLEHADHIDVGLHFTVTARFLDGDRFERSVPVRDLCAEKFKDYQFGLKLIANAANMSGRSFPG